MDPKKIVAQVTSLPKGTNPSIQTIVELLRALRKSKIRRSDLVANHGATLLKAVRSSWYSGQYVGNIEIWAIYEQIFVAALDVGDESLANACLLPLQKKFPESVRVQKLVGMLYEFKGEYKKARILYDTLLSSHPGDLAVSKRFVAAFKGEGDLQRAVEELQKLIKLFYGDLQLWEELAEIYLSMSDFSSAAFCYEELLLVNPSMCAYHLRLADIYYSIGTLGWRGCGVVGGYRVVG
jgi:tetratricopeptide (TPR) repeat protein